MDPLAVQPFLSAFGWLLVFLTISGVIESVQFLGVAAWAGGRTWWWGLGLLFCLAASGMATLALLVPDRVLGEGAEAAGLLRLLVALGCVAVCAWRAFRCAEGIVEQAGARIVRRIPGAVGALGAPPETMKALTSMDRVSDDFKPKEEFIERVAMAKAEVQGIKRLLRACRRAEAGEDAARWILWAWANWRLHDRARNESEATFWRGVHEAATLEDPSQRAEVEKSLVWASYWTSDVAQRRRSAGHTYFNNLMRNRTQKEAVCA